jgi:(p)ppGpp synthase/HD superfamily hydrolase
MSESPIDFSNSVLVHDAYQVAKEAHRGVFRQYTGEPYINHPVQVARMVATVPHTNAILAAALLHDVLEDTDYTEAKMRERFGDEVTDLVRMVTKVSRKEDGPRATRVAIDIAHLAKASSQGKTIKLADITSNCTTIAQHDPERAVGYLNEKLTTLQVLTDGDKELWNTALETILAGLRHAQHAVEVSRRTYLQSA